MDINGVQLNREVFDKLLLPAFCSIRSFTIDRVSYEFPFELATSLHATCKDDSQLLKHIYFEGELEIFDRYLKNLETEAVVGRVKRSAKTITLEKIAHELNKDICFIDICEYTSYYRIQAQFNNFKRLEKLSTGRISVIDTRQFCLGLQSLTNLGDLRS